VRKFTVALILAVVALVGVCLPAAAQYPALTSAPEVFSAYLNGTNSGNSEIQNGALVKDISVVTQGWGGKYKLEIQSGTKISLYPNGTLVFGSALLKVYVSSNIVTFTTNCILYGKPITIYKLAGEEWVKLSTVRCYY
jgi:hypothetical protein